MNNIVQFKFTLSGEVYVVPFDQTTEFLTVGGADLTEIVRKCKVTADSFQNEIENGACSSDLSCLTELEYGKDLIQFFPDFFAKDVFNGIIVGFNTFKIIEVDKLPNILEEYDGVGYGEDD